MRFTNMRACGRFIKQSERLINADMKILHVLLSRRPIPPPGYGGTERIVWWLLRQQVAHGHDVRVLTRGPSRSSTPPVMYGYDSSKPISDQVSDWPDVVHFHHPGIFDIGKPYLCTEHGLSDEPVTHSTNTVYLSQSHASNHGASFFIHNGLDWADYGEVNLSLKREHYHFLGKAKLQKKNLTDAIELAKAAGLPIQVMGNKWYQSRLARNIKYHGEVDDAKKGAIIERSLGMLAPVRWHEPFGLALVESLYFGAPIFGTPYGSLPELVNQKGLGYLSTSKRELIAAMCERDYRDSSLCHEVAVTTFNAGIMAARYLDAYQKVIDGEQLQPRPPCTAGTAGTLLQLAP